MAKKKLAELEKEAMINEALRQQEVDIIVENRLVALYTLQSVDTKIDKIRIIRGELPLEVQDLEDEITGLHTRISNFQSEISSAEKAVSEHKNAIAEHKELIKKYEKQQENVRNNREFESLNKEIERALSTLTERERDIVKYFFGIGTQEMTLEEIGEKFDLTRERVRQIKEKAIRKLRQSSRSIPLKSYLG